MILKGIIVFGCYIDYFGGFFGCMIYYDNVRVWLVVKFDFMVNFGDMCYLVYYNDFVVGDKEWFGDFCK